MTTRSLRSLVAAPLVAAALLVSACGDDAPGPEAGPVTVTLRSPNGAEGGAVFLISGEEVTTADTDGGSVFVRQVEGATRVVVVREPAGEIRFRMDVRDVHRPPDVEVVEVAGPDDALRASVVGYTAEVAR